MPVAVQFPILLLPADGQQIGNEFSLARRDGYLTIFHGIDPVYTCSENDAVGVRLAAALYSLPGLASPPKLAEALNLGRSTVFYLRDKYETEGLEGLKDKKRGPKGAHKLTDDRLPLAQRYLDEGLPNTEVARRLEVAEGTIRAAMAGGRLHRPGSEPTAAPSPSSEPTQPRERSEEDLAASGGGGVAVKRHLDRTLARVGLLPEAEPIFSAAESVQGAGVLLALPVVSALGLFEVGQKVYGRLKNGYFGLTSVLLIFVFMALLRIKSIEQLYRKAPGELGRLLGLDRAPEPKTLRRKLKEMGLWEKAQAFREAFSRRWAALQPDLLGFLYIDGHVRPYHGRTHKLAKAYVTVRRLAMPATTDYWVNDAFAQPLFFVTAPLNEELLEVMDTKLLPHIRELAAEQRVTLIFDREGYSPKRFQAWSTQGFDVLTYRKGSYEPWLTDVFSEHEAVVSGRRTTYLLAERSVVMRRGFWMREIRCLTKSGHQTAILTTLQDPSAIDLACRMFSRWQQENFFRYMRQEFALDRLATYAFEPVDPERLIPNPEKRDLKKQLDSLRAQRTKIEQELGRLALNPPSAAHDASVLHQQIEALDPQIEDTRTRLKDAPKKVPVKQLKTPIVKLEPERKIISDCIKMVAYRAETELAHLVGPLLGSQHDEARAFLQSVFQATADLLPDPDRKLLVVRFHALSTPRANRTLHALCDIINDYDTTYPGSTSRLVFQAPESQE